MATAQKTEIEVTQKVPGVTLTLTEQEAQTLAYLTAAVSGSTWGSRGRTDAVYAALCGLGYRWDIDGAAAFERKVNGRVHFMD